MGAQNTPKSRAWLKLTLRGAKRWSGFLAEGIPDLGRKDRAAHPPSPIVP